MCWVFAFLRDEMAQVKVEQIQTWKPFWAQRVFLKTHMRNTTGRETDCNRKRVEPVDVRALKDSEVVVNVYSFQSRI